MLKAGPRPSWPAGLLLAKPVSSSVVNTDGDHNELSTLNTADDSPREAGELFLSYLNVEDLLESSSTEAKVVIVNSGGRVETFSSFHDKTKSIIVNLCRKKMENGCEFDILCVIRRPQSPTRLNVEHCLLF